MKEPRKPIPAVRHRPVPPPSSGYIHNVDPVDRPCVPVPFPKHLVPLLKFLRITVIE